MSSRRNRKRASQLARAQLAARRRRRRMIWTSVVVVAVLVIAGGVSAAIYVAHRKTQSAEHYALPAGATRDKPGVPVSRGDVTVDVYLDYMCPHCKEFESLASSVLNEYTTNKKIRLVYHPLNFLDRFSSGTHYSTRAAAAAGCAADASKLPAFTSALFDKQPKENSTGLTNQQIVKIGKDAGITDKNFASCVTSQKYATWVTHVSNKATAKGVTQTPTVFVNGKRIDATVTALTSAVNSKL